MTFGVLYQCLLETGLLQLIRAGFSSAFHKIIPIVSRRKIAFVNQTKLIKV